MLRIIIEERTENNFVVLLPGRMVELKFEFPTDPVQLLHSVADYLELANLQLEAEMDKIINEVKEEKEVEHD